MFKINMSTIKLENEKIKKCRLALGTVQFGLAYGIANTKGKVQLEKAAKIIHYAKENGIHTIDTASSYGESEKILGEIGVNDLNVITKIKPLPDSEVNVSDWVMNQVNQSLTRLNIAQLYGLLLHKSSDLIGTNGWSLYKALREVQEKGLVRKIGISIYSPTELEKTKKYRYDIVQAPYSIVDQRLATSGWLKRLKDQQCEVHARSIFLQGLLLMSRKSIPEKFSRWASLWDTWHSWLIKERLNAVGACVRFPLDVQEIDRVIVGAQDVTQLEQIKNEANIQSTGVYPKITSTDLNLINPYNWTNL
jgi:aryl-alcohol dehydrogenase-like predicted oxidoreductase